MRIDKETVEELRKSKGIVGPLRPCIRDQKGKLLAGLHRKKADPDWPEIVLSVRDELEGELIGLHDGVQRVVSQKETQERLLRIAKLLKVRGVPPQNIAKEVAKLVPYTETHVYSLLPEEFKIKQLRVNDKVVEHIQESVKGLGRVEASRMLAKHLNQTIPSPKGENDITETEESAQELMLPYPDCLCAGCPHSSKCKFLWG